MIKFQWYQFSELTNEQLYELLAQRSAVFVVEQQIIYLDPDGKDQAAYHLLGMENQALHAYLRLFPPTTHTQKHIVFGRVLTSKSARNKGYGKKLIQELLDYCHRHFPGVAIQCSAQHYLQAFYENFGFKVINEVYEKEGIPHIEMQRVAHEIK